MYKPGRGERHLWDFPEAIYRREVAAYELSQALGWDIVPETVERDDAPLGPGSLQRFVPADFSEHHFTLVEHEDYHDQLRTICAFDVVANNADRKSGHCILGDDGRIWAIDNGLCFHVEPKLRTVIWEFAGRVAARPSSSTTSPRWPSPRPSPCAAAVGAKRSTPWRRRAERLLEAGPIPGPRPRHPPLPLAAGLNPSATPGRWCDPVGRGGCG